MHFNNSYHPPCAACAEALYVNDHPTPFQQTCRNQTVFVRGQNLKVKYKSIQWIKGMFVDQ